MTVLRVARHVPTVEKKSRAMYFVSQDLLIESPRIAAFSLASIRDKIWFIRRSSQGHCTKQCKYASPSFDIDFDIYMESGAD